MSKKDGRQTTFYELKGYTGAVAQIDEGMKTTGHLVNLMDQRARIEKEYAQKLDKWASQMNGKLKKMKEHQHCQAVWTELIAEANCTATIHRSIMTEINEKCVNETKQWKAQTWKSKMFGGTEQKTKHEKNFATAQKTWSVLVNNAKKAKSSYDKACQAVQTQQANVGSLSTGAPEGDPKVQKAQSQLETKTIARDNSKTAYETAIHELGQVKDQYINDMNAAFNDVVNFEQERIDFSRKMMITYRDSCKQKITNTMTYDVKMPDGQVDQVKVSHKIGQIDAAVQGQNVTTAIQEFQQIKGPGNAAGMQWPEFEDYNPDAIAQQNKFNKSNNGGAVARNDTEGTIRQISNEGMVNGGYDEVPTPGETAPPPLSPTQYEAPTDWDSPPEAEPTGFTNGAVDGAEVYVQVQFPYEAMDTDELTLEEGEQILKIGDPDSEGWCQGRKADGTVGMFPVDYVDQGEVES